MAAVAEVVAHERRGGGRRRCEEISWLVGEAADGGRGCAVQSPRAVGTSWGL